MQALILAGGLGTRLRPLTLKTPKPIVPIGNQPFLLRQIESLKTAGVTKITLSLNYQPSAIEKLLGDGSEFGVQLRYLIEPSPMGTAGAYKFAEKFLEETTVVLNGDILTDIDLLSVANKHKTDNALATIVLTPVENPSAYGLVQVGGNSDILRFLEKPSLEEIEKLKINTINAGIYIFEPPVLGYIPENENYSFEYQLFPDLLRNQEKFQAFVADDNYWLDIGTTHRYLQANQDLIAGKIRNSQVLKSNNSEVSDSAEISEKSLMADGCVIKSGAKIINSVLGENVRVGENAIVQNSVIWTGTTIDSDSIIADSIIGYNCQIGKNVLIQAGYVLGDNSILTDFTRC